MTYKQLIALAFVLSHSAYSSERAISSLGRLEPHNGIVRLSGPSGGSLAGAVIKSLSVNEGEWVEKGQVIAQLDSYSLRIAEVARLQAILEHAESQMARQQNLSRTSATSQSRFDQAKMDLAIAKADLAAAKAHLELSIVRSPLRAQILEIHATPGERVGPEGIVELAQTDRMYAIAEVYETDIDEVSVGQNARILLPANRKTIVGKVERIALKVGRLDVMGTDPIAKTDARVVEVFILLDDSSSVAAYTNMQVEVEIKP